MMPLVVSLFHWFHQHSLWINSFLLSLLVFCFFFHGQKEALQSKRRKLESLPFPPRLPAMGNLHQLGSLAHHSLQSLSEKYGPLLLVHIGRIPAIIPSSSPHLKQLGKSRRPMTLPSRAGRSRAWLTGFCTILMTLPSHPTASTGGR